MRKRDAGVIRSYRTRCCGFLMDVALFISFLAATAILTITPGVDTAMVLRATAVEGRRVAIFCSLGIGSGCLLWGSAVAAGLGALLQTSDSTYTTIKFVGAAYLVWLGIPLFFKPRATFDTVAEEASDTGGRNAFIRGFLTNMLNPKVGIFYITFLPQFVPADVPVAAYSFVLSSIHVGLTLVWFSLLITATAPLKSFLRRPGAMMILDRLTGGVFIAFGVKLASSQLR
jgi:threonine/homoserine/homoserine lactone efflux protein